MRAAEIRIETACGMDWQGMRGQGAKRFCGECQKHVHDLSEMSAVEARALLTGPSTEELCVRYLYDENGEIFFAGAKLLPTSALVKAKRFAAAALVAALPLSLTACMGSAQRPPAPPAQELTQTMGYPTMVPVAADAGTAVDAAPVPPIQAR
jgi:hypothetical protein